MPKSSELVDLPELNLHSQKFREELAEWKKRKLRELTLILENGQAPTEFVREAFLQASENELLARFLEHRRPQGKIDYVRFLDRTLPLHPRQPPNFTVIWEKWVEWAENIESYPLASEVGQIKAADILFVDTMLQEIGALRSKPETR